MTTEQGDRVVALLECIAVALKARVPRERRPMTPEERAGWRDLNRGPNRATAGDPAGEYPTSTVRSRERFFEEGQ